MENGSLASSTHDLHRNDHDKQQNRPPLSRDQRQGNQQNGTGKIDRIAEARIQSVCNEPPCLRSDRKRLAQLITRYGDPGEDKREQNRADNPHGRPPQMRASCDKYDNANLDDSNDKQDDAGCTHTITIAVRFLTRTHLASHARFNRSGENDAAFLRNRVSRICNTSVCTGNG